ncbi:MAG: hypothetical protein JO339_02800 [Alphaproteobacteria bacterium]|nr:hypothetical protein [Alphaproteobacteria bacterium]
MTLRPEYRLGHSEYNRFLHASVGVEKKIGAELTVLSAFVRLGIDPWQEAARLSDFPRKAAAQALAETLAALPDGIWDASQSEATAARLVSWLPERSTLAIPLPGGSARHQLRTGKNMKSSARAWLAWGVLALALFFLIQYFATDMNLEPARGKDPSTQE